MENYGAALARKLHALGLNDLAATLLEAGGPFAFLGAQALYLVAPLWGPPTTQNQAMALAHMLEDPASMQVFIKALAERSQD